MSDPDDLSRLRLRLAELPGFDPVGLRVTREDGLAGTAVGDGFVVIRAPSMAFWQSGDPWAPWATFVTTADASTRDRVARWVAGRLGKDVGPSGPCWGAVSNGYEGGGWALLSRLGRGMSIFMDPDRLPLAALPPLVPGGESVWVGVPALATLDPRDDRLLPDGSRWVDAAALAEVARHVGVSRG